MCVYIYIYIYIDVGVCIGIYGSLTDTTILSQSCPGSNGNEGVLYIPPNFRTGTSPSYGLVSYPEHSLVCVWGILPDCRDAVSIF